jgi:hypothetical protein
MHLSQEELVVGKQVLRLHIIIIQDIYRNNIMYKKQSANWEKQTNQMIYVIYAITDDYQIVSYKL